MKIKSSLTNIYISLITTVPMPVLTMGFILITSIVIGICAAIIDSM